MSIGRAPASTVVAGATAVDARALQRLAHGLVRDAAGVALDDVSVQLGDQRGDLRVSVSVPVALAGAAGTTLAERGDSLRDAVVRGMRDLAARRVRAVDVHYTGVRRSRGRRVA